MKKLSELDVAMVIADMTDNDASTAVKDDLARIKLEGGGTQSLIPVNMIYPADYPASPAIMLDAVISPDQVLEALGQVSGNPIQTASRQ